jgi:hypothetical protein
MLNQSKILPFLALAAALAPFAASARSDHAPLQNPAHRQYLAGNFGDQHAVTNGGGRGAEVNRPARLFIVDSSAQFAALSTISDKN